MKKILLFSLLFLGEPAYAYLDPGASSIFLQALIASLFSMVGFICIYYNKLKVFIRKFLRKSQKDSN